GKRSFFQVFSTLPPCTDPTCAAIQHHGSKADCTASFATPIIGDLDGDGRPSCDGDCVTDPGDVAAVCGATLPLPDCEHSKPVSVYRDSDYSTADVIPGSSPRDRAAAPSGADWVRQDARIAFAARPTAI